MIWLALACTWCSFPDFSTFHWPDPSGLTRVIGKPGLMINGPGGHHLAPDGKSVEINGVWYDPAAQKPIPPLLVKPPKGYVLQQIFSNNEMVLKKGTKYEIRPPYKEKSRAWFESDSDVEFSPNGKFALRAWAVPADVNGEVGTEAKTRIQFLDLTDEGALSQWQTRREVAAPNGRETFLFRINRTGSHFGFWNLRDYEITLGAAASDETRSISPPVDQAANARRGRERGFDNLEIAPNGKKAVIKLGNKLFLADTASGELKPFGPKNAGYYQRMVFPPDGQSICICDGYRGWHRVPLDPDANAIQEGLHQFAGQIDYSDDGRTLVHFSEANRLMVVDTKSLRPLAGSDCLPAFDSIRIVDANTALAWNSYGALLKFDFRTGKILWDRRWAVSELGGGGHTRISPSPDGELGLIELRAGLALVELRTGKIVREHPKMFLGNPDQSFSVDGNVYRIWIGVASPDGRGSQQILESYETKTGEQVPNRSKWDSHDRMQSADQKTALVNTPGRIQIVEVETGAERWGRDYPRLYRRGIGQFDGLRFTGISSDGSTVVAVEASEIKVYDAMRGSLIAQRKHEIPEDHSARFALSPSGRWLAEWGQDSERLTLRDIGGERAKPLDTVGIGPEKITALAWTPNEKTLIVSSADGAIRVYDFQKMSKLTSESKSRPDEWLDLSKPEGGEAVLRLYREPLKALDLFKAQLKPIAPGDPKNWQKWIEELGSKDFKVRESASKALSAEFDQVGPLLLAAWKDSANEEQAQRLRLLFDEGHAKPSPERLRESRAVELLEKFGNSEAKKLLETLATGAPAANLTREAKWALKRLKERE